MELRHLRYFHAIGREEHFGRAAATLRVAQPALTRQIRALEAELGVELFERLPRGVRLSAAGRLFLEDAGDILAQVERAVDRVKRLANGHLGVVRLGLSEIVSEHDFISQGLLDFRASEPGIMLELKSMGSTRQIAALAESVIDVGIVYDAHLSDADEALFERVPIGTGKTMLAVYEGHPLADSRAIALEELRDEPILWPTRATARGYHDRLMGVCLDAGFSPRIVQECTTNSIMLSLVAVGMGLGFITSSTPVFQSRNIRLVPIADLDISFTVLLLWRRHDRSAALQRFLEEMRSRPASL